MVTKSRNSLLRLEAKNIRLTSELNEVFLLPFYDEEARNDTLIKIFNMPQYYGLLSQYIDLISPRLYEFLVYNKPPFKPSESKNACDIKRLQWRLGRNMSLPRKFEAKKHKYKH